MATKREIIAKRDDDLIEEYLNNPHPVTLGQRFGVTRGNVNRIIRRAFKAKDPRVWFDKDDPAATAAHERKQDMAKAHYHANDAVALWRQGYEVEQIAKQTRLKPQVIRAAIYMAIQAGNAGGAFAKTEPKAEAPAPDGLSEPKGPAR